MLEDSYLCEANIEAAQIMIDREWQKSLKIKNSYKATFYVGLAIIYPCAIKKYWEILFLTHGGY